VNAYVQPLRCVVPLSRAPPDTHTHTHTQRGRDIGNKQRTREKRITMGNARACVIYCYIFINLSPDGTKAESGKVHVRRRRRRRGYCRDQRLMVRKKINNEPGGTYNCWRNGFDCFIHGARAYAKETFICTLSYM